MPTDYSDYLRQRATEEFARGNPQALFDYWAYGEGADKIAWGTDGDFSRCMKLVGKYLPDAAGGFCQNRHMEIYGESNAARDARQKAKSETEEFYNKCHSPEDGKFCDDEDTINDVIEPLVGESHSFDNTISHIASIHDVPDDSPSVTYSEGIILNPNEQGYYRHISRHITVSHKGITKNLTFTHEFGHYLQHEAGVGMNESSTLKKVVEGSDNVKTLKGMDDEHAEYLLLPEELFSRAYAQWITTKPGGEHLKTELDHIRSQPHNLTKLRQWSDSDFRPISAALDKLFRDKGLMP